MNHRNLTTYTATLANIKLDAFGIRQTLPYEGRVEIYQARANPELWRARPMFSKGQHKWEANSAVDLARLITADFERVIKPWKVYFHPDAGKGIRAPELDWSTPERKTA